MKKKFWILGIAVLVLAAAAVGVWAKDAPEVDTGDKPAEERGEEIIAAEGYLVGRIDSHSVEIELDGEPQAFGLSEELRDREFSGGVEVSFEYYLDENGRGIITWMEQKGENGEEKAEQAAEGVFVGFADSHTVEIEVAGEPKAFGLDKGVDGTDLQEGEGVKFHYKENENGRPVITRLERTSPTGGNGGEDRRDENGTDQNVISAEGHLVGRIDSHSVEIELDGKPQAFALGEELREKEFAPGEIRFQYYVDENGRSVITEADFQEPRDGEVHTAEGVFSGLADSHTAEIEIGGVPKAFGLDENIDFAGLEEGQELFIAYQEDETGRQVIIKIEKIF